MILDKNFEAAICSHYFNYDEAEFELIEQRPLRWYFRVTHGNRDLFLKVVEDYIPHPTRYDHLRSVDPQLLDLIPTKDNKSFLELDGLRCFLHPFIEGKTLEPSTENTLNLAKALGRINGKLSEVKAKYIRPGYDTEITESLIDSVLEKTGLNKSEFELVLSLWGKSKSRPDDNRFEYVDCHASNVMVNDEQLVLVDIDSVATVPCGTALGMLIERMADDIDSARMMFEAYGVDNLSDENLDSVLGRSQYETLRRIGYILNELQKKSESRWVPDLKKHIGNLNKVQSFREALL